MSGRDEDFDAQLAERGDDRPGLGDLEADDFSALQLDDDDETDEDDVDEDDEDDEYPEDATDDEIDVIVALYHEDGKPLGLALPKDLANDFDELIGQLRRVPGDAGALGVVIIDSDFFVLIRVRGKKVETVLSDVVAANDWPIARDAADYLGEDIPEDDDEGGAVGDLDMFADVGLSEFDLEQMLDDLEADPEDVVSDIVGKLGFAAAYKRVAGSSR